MVIIVAGNADPIGKDTRRRTTVVCQLLSSQPRKGKEVIPPPSNLRITRLSAHSPALHQIGPRERLPPHPGEIWLWIKNAF